MEGLLKTTNRISRFLNVIAGVSLTFLMLLTITDVILRGFKRPVVGTYELVAFAGAVAIGFSMPLTSWLRGTYFCGFFYFKVFPKGEKRVQYCLKGRCDHIIYSHRLEPDQIWEWICRNQARFPLRYRCLFIRLLTG